MPQGYPAFANDGPGGAKSGQRGADMQQQNNVETIVIEELISMSTAGTAVPGHTLISPWSTTDFQYTYVILNGQFFGSVPVNLLTISYPINVAGRTYTRQGVFFGGPSPVDIQKGVLSPTES